MYPFIIAIALHSALLADGFVPAFDPDRLFAEAQNIAVLQVVGDEVLNPPRMEGNERGWILSTLIVQSLKGDALPLDLNVSVSHFYRPFDGGAPLEQGDNVVAFLVPGSEPEQWRLADAHYGLFRVSWIRAEPKPNRDPRKATLAELTAALSDDDPDVLQGALKAFAGFQDRSCLGRAKQLSASRNEHVAAEALKTRFVLGDGTGFRQVVKLFDVANKLSSGERDLLAWSMVRASGHIPVANLNDLLLRSPHSILQTVAAYVLAQEGDESSFPALAAGLSKKDKETQYRCVIGLCRLTGKPGPGHEEFMNAPKATLERWKGWWKAQNQPKREKHK